LPRGAELAGAPAHPTRRGRAVVSSADAELAGVVIAASELCSSAIEVSRPYGSPRSMLSAAR
jgi:hypothetical protein